LFERSDGRAAFRGSLHWLPAVSHVNPFLVAALILPLVEAAEHLPARGALIGLDLGSKTIGVATSDPDRRIATAVETVSRKKFAADAARLLALASERNAAGFVLGLPVNMDGSEGRRAQSTRAFARNLARLTDLPIALWDERLSTAAAERALIAADVSRARRARVIDQHAAVFILQGALDRLARCTVASNLNPPATRE
jgi:putative Holliday junction resolvase